MTTPTRLPTGRNKDDYSRPKLDLTPMFVSASADAFDWSRVTATDDNISALRAQLQMLGNDLAGDCVSARLGHHRFMLTGHYMIMDQIWAFYKTQNQGFIPDNGPHGFGSNDDQGMSTDAALDYLHKNGSPDGGELLAFGTIDPTNILAVSRAIAIFGGVWVDILVQPGNQTEFQNGQDWTNTGEAPEGGHAVLAGAYAPKLKFITWADIAEFAENFWTGKAQGEALVERVYVVVWKENITDHFYEALDIGYLQGAFQALLNRPLVLPTPVPVPPTPTPTPVPPAPGAASFPGALPEVDAHIVASAHRARMSVSDYQNHRWDVYFGLKPGRPYDVETMYPDDDVVAI